MSDKITTEPPNKSGSLLAPAGLLGCPFCGGNAVAVTPYHTGKVVMVGCFHPECGVNPRVKIYGEEKAREIWNTRWHPNNDYTT